MYHTMHLLCPLFNPTMHQICILLIGINLTEGQKETGFPLFNLFDQHILITINAHKIATNVIKFSTNMFITSSINGNHGNNTFL